MLNMMTDFAVKAASKSGWNSMALYGGGAAAIGATYGAISDTETMVSGAFRGAVIGSAGGAGLKVLGDRYVTGMNARMAAGLDIMDGKKGLGSFSTADSATKQARATANFGFIDSIGDFGSNFGAGKEFNLKTFGESVTIDQNLYNRLGSHRETLSKSFNEAIKTDKGKLQSKGRLGVTFDNLTDEEKISAGTAAKWNKKYKSFGEQLKGFNESFNNKNLLGIGV